MPIPKGTRWGVDSFLPIHKPTGGKKSLLEFVVDKMKEVPDYWGRYIGKVRNGDSRLQKPEVEFLRRASGGTRLLLIFNGISNPTVNPKNPDPVAEFETGKFDALSAISAAKEVDAPGEVVIYANVEPKTGRVSSNWIRGWWEGMKASKHGFGGIYGNLSVPGPNLGFIGNAFNQALTQMPSGFDPPLWAAFPRPAKFQKAPAKIDFGYQPGEPPGAAGTAVIWQYAVNWFPIDPDNPMSNGRFDTDLALVRGFQGMWKLPPAPKQPEGKTPHERDDLEESLL